MFMKKSSVMILALILTATLAACTKIGSAPIGGQTDASTSVDSTTVAVTEQEPSVTDGTTVGTDDPDLPTPEVCSHLHTTLTDFVQNSCTEDGYSGDTYCADCGEMLAEGTVIASTGHLHFETVSEISATCTEAGYTGDTKCID